MGKSLRSAILVELCVFAIAATLLVHFARSGIINHRPLLDAALMLGGLLVTGWLMLLIWHRTLERESMVRRFFLSPHWIYNAEIGYAPLAGVIAEGGAYGVVTFAADALALMSYAFKVAETPTSFEPRFVIDSNIFLYHLSGASSEDEDGGVVVDEWRGTLLRVTGSSSDREAFEEISSFNNAAELAHLLEDLEALVPQDERGDLA